MGAAGGVDAARSRARRRLVRGRPMPVAPELTIESVDTMRWRRASLQHAVKERVSGRSLGRSSKGGKAEVTCLLGVSLGGGVPY